MSVAAQTEHEQLAINGGAKAVTEFEGVGEPKIGVQEFVAIARRFGFSPAAVERIAQAVSNDDLTGGGPNFGTYITSRPAPSANIQFARKARELFDSPFALGTSSGTGALHAAKTSGAPLVVLDNLYGYGRPTAPLTETSPVAPCSRKGELRARVAEQLLAAHRSGAARVAIARASDFYGPRVMLAGTFGERFFSRVVKGKPTECFGDPSLPHSYSYVRDVADGLVTLALAPEKSVGGLWHLPVAPAESTAAVADRFSRALGFGPGRTTSVPPGRTTRSPRAMSAMSPYLSDCMPEDRVATQPPSVECVNESGKCPMVQPRAAKCLAVARPMPLAAPVMKMVLADTHASRESFERPFPRP